MVSDIYIDILLIENSVEISDTDLEEIVDKIKKRQEVVLFKSYWNHEGVTKLSNKYLNRFSDDDLFWYVDFLLEMIERRTQTHWVERINIFHSFGLAARKNPDLMRGAILDKYIPRCSSKINNFVDYSAKNMMCMANGGYDESIQIIEQMSENVNLMKGIGQYNIKYYTDILSLANKMEAYLRMDRGVIVPQTVASVMAVMANTEYDDEEIDAINDVLHRLHKKIQIKINGLLKKIR